jgi:hypothetical protein
MNAEGAMENRVLREEGWSGAGCCSRVREEGGGKEVTVSAKGETRHLLHDSDARLYPLLVLLLLLLLLLRLLLLLHGGSRDS